MIYMLDIDLCWVLENKYDTFILGHVFLGIILRICRLILDWDYAGAYCSELPASCVPKLKDCGH